MDINSEIIEKAQKAASAEEILALAKENGIDLTEQQAKECFERLNGELSDDEIENVSGGGFICDRYDPEKNIKYIRCWKCNSERVGRVNNYFFCNDCREMWPVPEKMEIK